MKQKIRKRKIQKERRVSCKCEKCGKPYSFDKLTGLRFGNLCRECATK